jgi:hypothetical protein
MYYFTFSLPSDISPLPPHPKDPCMYMYICMVYICIYIWIYIYIKYIHINIHENICKCIWMVYIYICIYIYFTNIYIYTLFPTQPYFNRIFTLQWFYRIIWITLHMYSYNDILDTNMFIHIYLYIHESIYIYICDFIGLFGSPYIW